MAADQPFPHSTISTLYSTYYPPTSAFARFLFQVKVLRWEDRLAAAGTLAKPESVIGPVKKTRDSEITFKCTEKAAGAPFPRLQSEDIPISFENIGYEGLYWISAVAGLLRCGKSCRLRWANHLRPHLKRGNFAEDEDELIIKLHALLGNKWSLIAGRLPGRTDNEIKNYWNVHLKRKLLGRGVDPQTHRPIQHQHQQHRHLSPGTVDLSSIQSQSVHDVSEAASGTTDDDHPELNLELCIGTLASSHADQGNGVRADSSNDMESGGRTSAKDDLKVLIKPVCHRVDRLRPRTLLLLR